MIEVLVLIFGLIGALFAWVIISARRSLAYVFCNATISAWEARLLSESRLMEFADAPKIMNVFSALEDTEYRAQLLEITKDEKVDIFAVERALRESVNTRFRELLNMTPNVRKGTISRLLQRVDLWNLKAIITMIHNNVPVNQRLHGLLPSPIMSPQRLEILASAEDLDRLLEFLKGSEYFDVISSTLGEYEKLGLIVLLSALDKHYFTSLWKDVKSKRHQRSILKSIVGYEIDSVNVKLILRLKQEGVPRDEIDRYVVRPSYEINEAMLKAMIVAEDIRTAVHMIHITKYGKLLSDYISKIEKHGIPAAERLLDEAYLKLCRWIEFTNFFGIAPMISFIKLKENEMKNLRSIIKLKADQVEPSKIKEKIKKVPKVEL